uniref:Rel homology dimerisation domain-containing protein n=1 Tax=Stomoxys calcitrans TaxID=35570 RepID=A0A1I8PSE3_STOCA
MNQRNSELTTLFIARQPKQNFHYRYLSELGENHGVLTGQEQEPGTSTTWPEISLKLPSNGYMEHEHNKIYYVLCSLHSYLDKRPSALSSHQLMPKGQVANHNLIFQQMEQKQDSWHWKLKDYIIARLKYGGTTKNKKYQIFRDSLKHKMDYFNNLQLQGLTFDELNCNADINDAKVLEKSVILNVCLGFTIFEKTNNSSTYKLTHKTIYSDNIYDGDDLKIIKLCNTTGSLSGGLDVTFLMNGHGAHKYNVHMWYWNEKKNQIVWEKKIAIQKKDIVKNVAYSFDSPDGRELRNWMSGANEIEVKLQVQVDQSTYKSNAVGFKYRNNDAAGEEPQRKNPRNAAEANNQVSQATSEAAVSVVSGPAENQGSNYNANVPNVTSQPCYEYSNQTYPIADQANGSSYQTSQTNNEAVSSSYSNANDGEALHMENTTGNLHAALLETNLPSIWVVNPNEIHSSTNANTNNYTQQPTEMDTNQARCFLDSIATNQCFASGPTNANYNNQHVEQGWGKGYWTSDYWKSSGNEFETDGISDNEQIEETVYVSRNGIFAEKPTSPEPVKKPQQKRDIDVATKKLKELETMGSDNNILDEIITNEELLLAVCRKTKDSTTNKELVLRVHNKIQQNLLHRACFRNRANAIKPLVGMGFGLHEQDVEGRTPLHLALEYGHTECISQLQLLMKKENYTKYSEDVLRTMIKMFQVHDNYGRTVLHAAVRANNFDLFETMLTFGHHNVVDIARYEVLGTGKSVVHLIAEQNLLDWIPLVRKYIPRYLELENYAGNTVLDLQDLTMEIKKALTERCRSK